jgi:amidohydrolase
MLLAAIVEPLGASWELDHERGAPPIVNDAWAVDRVVAAAGAVVGPGSVGPTTQSAGGEDFSWYGEVAPLGYFRLGVHRPGTDRVDLHAGSFDLDESAVALGARILAGAALEALIDLDAQAR